KARDMPVGELPAYIVVTPLHNKIYVANRDSNTVSVINGNTDTEIEQTVGTRPIYIMFVGQNKIYVANYGSNTVSVINAINDTKKPHDIPVGKGPISMAVSGDKLYVANYGSNTVSCVYRLSQKRFMKS
ncbi:MAG TPA: YncE family protein, partial [Candidatus Bathyarchaeia archaeon]|nr:YncE family protein [Candidatus Bathyarchaeia archaeon]